MKTLEAINRALEQKQGKGFRRHLGASLVGKPCARQVWYVFRWAKRSRFKARILRLFDRGNIEEERIVKWLRQSGTHTLDRDPETGSQFRIEDHNGHFGGSLDAKLFDAPDFPSIWVLGEFKTHNDKSFKELRKKGLAKAKPEHLVQAQLYMHYEQLPYCLHFNVNKNDDDLEVVSIEYDPSVAEKYIDRAAKIIYAEVPPQRISDSPGWYLCQWCDFNQICHFNAPMEMNCRTCVHSRPVENEAWFCTRYSYYLNETEQRMGCATHTPIQNDD
jgi:hypothetical protein